MIFLLPGWVGAAPVRIESVVATFHGGSEGELREAIDGVDVARHGWFAAPQTNVAQAAIFRTARAVEAGAMDITLCFLSGRPDSFFSDFTISATSDSRPELAGRWERLTPVRFDSTGPALVRLPDGHFRVEAGATDAVFQIAVLAGETPITGFRVDVFPIQQARGGATPRLTARVDGDFLLTEFRVEASNPRTTNIARGRPVRASHATRFPAEFLTDGLPGTFSHPLHAGLGSAFFFEIDLGAVRSLDHLALRNRGDGALPERLARLWIELYEAPPGSGARPVWKGRDRADGSHAGAGEVDVLHAGEGVGRFSGRWLRISSDSPVAFSPQLAEVEAYAKLGLRLASMRADGTALASDGTVRVPAGTRWLAMAMKPAGGAATGEVPIRWRWRGYHADWQTASGLQAEEVCPPPGRYLFEAQARHTDREWDLEILSMPMEVRPHFWQTWGFRLLLAALAAWGLGWAMRTLTRRRLAVLEAKAALETERARIARDMHDEVGAGLSQLAILQDIFAREHSLRDEAMQGMRQLAQMTRRIVGSLDEVVWAVNPKNDTLPSLAGYLEQCATAFLEPVEIACRLDAPFAWPEREVRAQVRHNVVLALREALQNVLKHSGAGEVTLKLRLEEALFIVVLADNGRGLTEERGGPGKDGLANMSARLAAVGGTCEVRSRAGGGTEVEMRVLLAHGASAARP